MSGERKRVGVRERLSKRLEWKQEDEMGRKENPKGIQNIGEARKKY